MPKISALNETALVAATDELAVVRAGVTLRTDAQRVAQLAVRAWNGSAWVYAPVVIAPSDPDLLPDPPQGDYIWLRSAA